ncbi:hypothetical protein M3J09_000498 [Ascochyta lentis]
MNSPICVELRSRLILVELPLGMCCSKIWVLRSLRQI